MPETTRQLAAIMFTDIVGYTAIMVKDEKKAIRDVQINYWIDFGEIGECQYSFVIYKLLPEANYEES